MRAKIAYKFLIIICVIIGVHSRRLTFNSTDVKSKLSSNNYCYNCHTSDNKVCMDGSCVCQKNYKQEDGSCEPYYCSTDSDCLLTNDFGIYCSNFSCICNPGYFEDLANGGKCTAHSQNIGCDECHYSDNKVCVDNQCYCGPDYQQIFDSVNTFHCQYIGCSTDLDCEVSQDIRRHCSFGRCVCNEDFAENWNNGRKCTEPTETSCTNDCLYSENKVCISEECVCRAGYTQKYKSLESWTCLYQGCSTDDQCNLNYKDYERQCSKGECVCKSGYVEDWNNGGKCTQPSSSYGCDNCYNADHKVCVDGSCYCQPDYRKQFKSPDSWNCVYVGCSTDSDCSGSSLDIYNDGNRHCSEGSCLCDTNYYDDWNNGRKCTWQDQNNVSLWSWAWLILAIPLIAILIWVCMKIRKRETQPPPYSPTD